MYRLGFIYTIVQLYAKLEFVNFLKCLPIHVYIMIYVCLI